MSLLSKKTRSINFVFRISEWILLIEYLSFACICVTALTDVTLWKFEHTIKIFSMDILENF